MTRTQVQALFLGLLWLPAGSLLRGQVTPPSWSAFDGTTPSIAAPGSPADAYEMSSVESINLSNGHLNLSFPLAQIIGRGGAKQTVVVHQEARWTVEGYQYQYNCYGGVCSTGTGYTVEFAPWSPNEPTWVQGGMVGRSSGAQCVSRLTSQGYQNQWDYVLTRLTFMAPDGTEHEFVDQATGGLLEQTPTSGQGFLRGHVWVATDGSGAVFVSYDPTSSNFYNSGSNNLNGTTYNPSAPLPTKDIYDGLGLTCGSSPFNVSGILTQRDGTKYKVYNGFVVGVEDRNGNDLDISSCPVPQFFQSGSCQFSAGDALGRTTKINYSANPVTVTYPDENDNLHTASVTYGSMSANMAPIPSGVTPACNGGGGFYPECNIGQLEPLNGLCQTNGSNNQCNNAQMFNPTVITQVKLANGSTYTLKYDSYGNVAELDLPTGGRYRYTHSNNLFYWSDSTSGGTFYHFTIVPALTSKAVYLHSVDTTPAEIIEYSPGTIGNSLAGNVGYFDGLANPLGFENHGFYYTNLVGWSMWGTDYNSWQAGKEYQTNYYAADGTTLLKSEATNWEQRPCTKDPGDPSGHPGQCWFQVGTPVLFGVAYYPPVGLNDAGAPPHDPRVKQKTVTMAGGSTSKSFQDSYAYSDSTDTYNNVIELDEYPFGNTSTPWRKTLTSYLATTAYTANGINLISLPTSKTVTDGSGNVKSLSCYNYDETAPQNESNIVNLDSWYSSSFNTRGNATTAKQWLSGTASCSSGTFLSSTYGYDVAGNMVSMLDPRTVKRLWGYQDSGTGAGYSYAFPTSITSYTGLNGGGTTFTANLTWDYDIGKPLTTKDINGNTSTYDYSDGLDRLRTVNKPDTGQTAFDYTDTPGAISVKTTVKQDPSPSIITVVNYDGLGRKANANLAGGTVETNYAYDGRGRLAYTSLAATGTPPTECVQLSWGATTPTCTPNSGTFTLYDGIGRPTSIIQAGGATTGTKYMADETLITDPAGAAKLDTADRDGNLVAVVEDPSSWYGGTLTGSHLAYSTSYTYDVLNDLTNVSQSSSRARSFTYDPLKRLLTAHNPESGTITYTYDAGSNLATRVDALSKTTCYGLWSSGSCNNSGVNGYDGLNRVVQKTYSDGTTPAVTYSYDGSGVSNGKGRLASVVSGVATTKYVNYDQMGRVWASSQSITGDSPWPFSYTYNLAGALVTETYPSGFVATNSYDAAGRVTGVAGNNGTNYVPYVAYDPTGPVSGLTLGNGVIEAWTFGTLQKQPTKLVVTALQSDQSYKVNDTWTWSYNGATTNNGNVTGATVYKTDWTNTVYVNSTQTFGYDLVNRLTASGETGSMSWTRNYGYDAWANGWVTTNSGLTLNSFTPVGSSNFDANNRLLIQGSTYNAAGNQTVIGGFGNTYDSENRQVTSTIGGVTTTYTYDGDGQRVQKVSGGTTTVYVYDAAGELSAEYDSAAAQPSACANCYLTADTLGSTRLITDDTGMPRECHDFLPFGEEIPRSAGCYATTTSNTLKFTGKERDAETGLDYFGARYLSSAQGRWTSPDWSEQPQPVPFADFADPQTLNLYGYVRNNPLGRADADGHCCLLENLEKAYTQTTTALKYSAKTLVNSMGMGLTNRMDFTVQNANLGDLNRAAANLTVAVITGGLLEGAPLPGTAPAEGTVTRYMGPGEAQTALKTGEIPNTNAQGEFRPTHVTTDAPMDSASGAKQRYELPADPSHRATVPSGRVTDLQATPDGRATTSGGGSQAATQKPIPVKPEELKKLNP